MVGHRTEWGIVMKTALLASLLTIGLGTAFATTTDELQITAGNYSAIITDGSTSPLVTSTCNKGSTLDSACSTLSLDTNTSAGTDSVNGTIDGWMINVASGTSMSPGLTPYGLDLTSLTATCTGGGFTGCSSDSLHIQYSDINFGIAVGAGGFTTTYSSTQTGSGTTSESAYFDNGNGIFAETYLIGTVGPFTSSNHGSAAGGSIAAVPNYSLTLDQVFTDANAGTVSFSVDGNVTGVPEPMSLLLLGGCLLVVGRKLTARLV